MLEHIQNEFLQTTKNFTIQTEVETEDYEEHSTTHKITYSNGWVKTENSSIAKCNLKLVNSEGEVILHYEITDLTL